MKTEKEKTIYGMSLEKLLEHREYFSGVGDISNLQKINFYISRYAKKYKLDYYSLELKK